VSRFILHVDLDEFIAAVEVLRRPELRGRPVVVGGTGDPTARGVVATASYEARRFGIGSGTPLRTALRKCPDAVFLALDRPAYEAASKRVMEVLAGFAAELEVAGWDEAFLALRTADPEAVARSVQHSIRAHTSLGSSVGIGDNKLQAKLASALAKPAGIFRLSHTNWSDVMGKRTTDALWGVGRKRSRRLAALGIETVAELAAADDSLLAHAFGPSTGPWLRTVARGEDDTPVTSAARRPRSVGKEKTFPEDITQRATARDEVRRLAGEVAAEIAEQRLASARVVVKVRYAPFSTRTRAVALRRCTVEQLEIEGAALGAFDALYEDRPVRLVGVRCELKRLEDVSVIH